MRIEATREREKKNTQILFYEALVRHSMKKKEVTIERRERANDERTKNKS